nr:DUF4124 domain-containing protein [uncultured Pseudomonas sp.]
MHGLHRVFFCVIAMASTTAQAATVFRCEDRQGNVTFTRQGCPVEQAQYLQEAYNPTPGSGKPIPLAQTARASHSKAKGKATSEPNGLIVVGEKQDGCGNRVTGSARREAVIKQQIRSGMTLEDVESSLGTPDKISRQNGQTRYHYRDQQGNSRQVSFDEAGCVKGKR